MKKTNRKEVAIDFGIMIALGAMLFMLGLSGGLWLGGH